MNTAGLAFTLPEAAASLLQGASGVSESQLVVSQ